jgi:hypothetical protein
MLSSALGPWPCGPLTLDLLVTAAGTPIPCNRAALCSGSAYFSSRLLEPSNPPPLTIDLPSVPADMFTRLLGCLYTGKLDCTPDSVYQLFWFAQMLQMPAAVLQCSQYLAQLVAPSPPPPAQLKVVKPIPSRGVPLLPAQQPGPFLRPHLASFYSDWFLRYSTLTRSRPEEEAAEPEAGPSRQRTEDQENVGSASGPAPPRAEAMFAGHHALLDTASCDGPVKFHRIVNKFFDLPKQTAVAATKAKDEELEVKGEDEQSDESNDTGETYSCVYCNHVFKSHYCYQKHKRRHINPVTVDIQGSAGGDQDKKFLVMKDLNVQYFPCKICGAKFPSYYFVHKHKKLWHRAQLELEQAMEEPEASRSPKAQ